MSGKKYSESDYINISNLVKLRIVGNILTDVSFPDDKTQLILADIVGRVWGLILALEEGGKRRKPCRKER